MIAAAPSPSELASLIGAIREQLATCGSAYAVVEELGVPVDVWRRAARRAARELGRPVTTLVGSGVVHAVLSDWPATDDERQIQRAALRRVTSAVAASFPVPRHAGHLRAL